MGLEQIGKLVSYFCCAALINSSSSTFPFQSGYREISLYSKQKKILLGADAEIVIGFAQ